MSGEFLFLKKGIKVKHRDKTKIVKSWFFTSTPVHNSDLIIILFEDGSNSGNDGFRFIKEIKEKA